MAKTPATQRPWGLMTGWPLIVNLRADPHEKMPFEGEMGSMCWAVDNLGLHVAIQEGSSLNAAGINCHTLKAAGAEASARNRIGRFSA